MKHISIERLLCVHLPFAGCWFDSKHAQSEALYVWFNVLSSFSIDSHESGHLQPYCSNAWFYETVQRCSNYRCCHSNAFVCLFVVGWKRKINTRFCITHSFLYIASKPTKQNSVHSHKYKHILTRTGAGSNCNLFSTHTRTRSAQNTFRMLNKKNLQQTVQLQRMKKIEEKTNFHLNTLSFTAQNFFDAYVQMLGGGIFVLSFGRRFSHFGLFSRFFSSIFGLGFFSSVACVAVYMKHVSIERLLCVHFTMF